MEIKFLDRGDTGVAQMLWRACWDVDGAEDGKSSIAFVKEADATLKEVVDLAE